MLPNVCTDAERHAIYRWLDGEGSDGLAHALGLGDVSRAEQRKEIKRFKNRMKKRLIRYSTTHRTARATVEVEHPHLEAR